MVVVVELCREAIHAQAVLWVCAQMWEYESRSRVFFRQSTTRHVPQLVLLCDPPTSLCFGKRESPEHKQQRAYPRV